MRITDNISASITGFIRLKELANDSGTNGLSVELRGKGIMFKSARSGKVIYQTNDIDQAIGFMRGYLFAANETKV